MAKKPPSYAAVELEPVAEAMPAAKLIAPAPADVTTPTRRGRPPAGRTLKEKSTPVMLYLHPAGAKALKRYAVDQNTKVHSLLLEALEAWARAKGLREPMRAE